MGNGTGASEARVLDALGDPTRRAVLELLRGGERSVRELTDATEVSQPAVSQHLRVLREAGLVTVRARGHPPPPRGRPRRPRRAAGLGRRLLGRRPRGLRRARRGRGPVVTGTASRPPVLRAAHVARPVDEAFAVFTDRIGAWWPLPTHGVFGADAGGLAFEDGLLVERATDGRTTVWGEVVRWEPPHRLVLTWHPGRDADDCLRGRGAVRRRPTAVARGSSSSTAGGSGSARMPSRAAARTSARARGATSSTTTPTAPSPVPARPTSPRSSRPTTRSSPRRCGAASAPRRRGSGTPPRVVAHVALSDLAMTAVAQALVHGRTDVEFTNVVCQDPEVLTAFVAETGDLAALVARGREIAATTTAAVQRLGSAQLATPVHCRLLHDGEVALDATLPWGSLAVDTQASTAPDGPHRSAPRPAGMT